jgi:hypothetical protein
MAENFSAVSEKPSGIGTNSGGLISQEARSGSSGNQNLDERGFVIREIKKNILSDMLQSIAVVPGYTSETSRKAKLPFAFDRKEDGKYVVYLPYNLETYADNWIFKCGVAAIAALDADVAQCQETTEQYKYLSDTEEYLHGLGAALKLGTLEKPVGGGLFQHGFMWAASFNLRKLPNPNMFRTSWHTPVYPLTKKEAWAGTAGGPHYNVWVALMTEAAKSLRIPAPENFCKSKEELQKLVKRSFHYEALAVFSAYEVSQMTDFIKPERDKLEKFVASLSRPTKDLVDRWPELHKEASSALSTYDERVGAIGSKRAQIIFPKAKAKGKSIRGMTRETRLAELEFGTYVKATNPTGLFQDDRLEFVPSPKGDEYRQAEEFLGWAEKHFSAYPPGTSSLTKEWLAQTSDAAKSLLNQK